ncbi:MAG: hypothetical protein V4590_05880 [Bacteroidota bacterium]
MNSTELATAIQKHSKELDALIASSFTNDVSPVHHELMKQKCIALYDLILQATPVSALAKPVPVFQPEPPPQPETIIQPDPTPVTLFTAPVSLVNDIPEKILEPVKEEQPAFKAEEPKTETEIQNEIIDEIIEQQQIPIPEEPIPVLKAVITELSLHEKISGALPPKSDLTERLITHISSLKSAINVNLKIAMVNDLFNESSVEYVKAIDKLNTAENIHEALRYFSELKHTYSWEADNVLVKELEALINKRYSA